MKYKFYEQELPVFDGDLQRWADSNFYIKEINWIAKSMKLDVNKFKIDDVTFGGEPVVFYAGKYFGYLDSIFYRYFDVDDWRSYWGFDN